MASKKKGVSSLEPIVMDEGPAREAVVPALRFGGGGWCPELGRSYERGVYRPKSMAEYEALRKYAEEETP